MRNHQLVLARQAWQCIVEERSASIFVPNHLFLAGFWQWWDTTADHAFHENPNLRTRRADV